MTVRSFAIVLRVLFALVLAPWTFGAVSAGCRFGHDTHAMTARGASLFAWARDHLDEEWHGYALGDDLGVGAFDAILLSELAVGLHQSARLDPAREAESARLLRVVADRIVSADTAPQHRPLTQRSLDDHNLYYTHALLVLSLSRLHGDDRRDALATSLARHLDARSCASDTFHARSYPGSPRWPADQSATLAALHAYRAAYGGEVGVRATRGWLAWMEHHRASGNLPWSATGDTSYTRIPRGCALSYITFYTAQFAPDESDRLYRAYVASHGLDVLGVSGFREWPPGVDRGSDADAGVVLFGWGMAATGIGLGAARIHGDEARVVGIERIADLVGVPVGRSYALAPTLGMAMLFAGETAAPWADEAGQARAPAPATTPAFPILPLGIAAVWLLLELLVLRPVLLRFVARLRAEPTPA